MMRSFRNKRAAWPEVQRRRRCYRAVTESTFEPAAVTLIDAAHLSGARIAEPHDGSPDEVGLGDDADDALILHHRKAADLVLPDDLGRLEGGRAGGDRGDLVCHDLRDRDAILIGVVASALVELRERAQEIAVREDADELAVAVDDGKMADARQREDRVGEIHRLVDEEGLDIGRHEVAYLEHHAREWSKVRAHR